MTEDPPYGFREVGISHLFSLCWTTGSTTMIVWWCQYTPLPTTSLGRRSLCWWNMNHLGRCCFLRAHFLRVQDWSSISPSELWESPLLPTWLTQVFLRYLPFSNIQTNIGTNTDIILVSVEHYNQAVAIEACPLITGSYQMVIATL